MFSGREAASMARCDPSREGLDWLGDTPLRRSCEAVPEGLAWSFGYPSSRWPWGSAPYPGGSRLESLEPLNPAHRAYRFWMCDGFIASPHIGALPSQRARQRIPPAPLLPRCGLATSQPFQRGDGSPFQLEQMPNRAAAHRQRELAPIVRRYSQRTPNQPTLPSSFGTSPQVWRGPFWRRLDRGRVLALGVPKVWQ